MYNIKECCEDSQVKHKSLAEEMYIIAKTEKELKDKEEFDKWLLSNSDLLDDIRNKVREAAYGGLFQLEVTINLRNVKFIVKYFNDKGFTVTPSKEFYTCYDGTGGYKNIKIEWEQPMSCK